MGDKKVSSVNTWSCRPPVGGRFDKTPLSFTQDSRYIFSVCGSSVKLYSAVSGALVRVLRGHSRTVTGLVENPTNFLQLYTCSHDGSVKLWNFHEAKLLQSFRIDTTGLITGLAAHSETGQLYLSVKQNDGTIVGELEGSSFKPLFQGKINRFYLSPSGNYIVATGSKICKVFNLRTRKVFDVNVIDNDSITCSAIHPQDHMLALGNKKGATILYRINSNDAGDLTFSKLAQERWHHGPVGALAWDTNGVKLISGGCESVLVFWDYSSGIRDFIARLGVANIERIIISPNQSMYALQCSDNSIMMYDMMKKKITITITGVAYKKSGASIRFLVSPQHKALAFAGPSGAIQFFDPRTDVSLGSLQVGALDRAAWRNDQTTKVGSRVCGFEFSSDGRWLVSVDRRKLYKAVDKLQFWEYSNRRYTLNTQTEAPHKGLITFIAFHPNKNMCVTCSSDGKFKIWEAYEHFEDYSVEVKKEQPKDPKQEKLEEHRNLYEPTHLPTAQEEKDDESQEVETVGEGQETSEANGEDQDVPLPGRRRVRKELWRFRSEGCYRDVSITSASFSSDGSTLAIAYQHNITLWDPLDNSLISTLTYPPASEPIVKLSFSSSSAPHHLIAHSRQTVWVWDLLSYSVSWELKANCFKMVTDPLSDRFALVCKDNKTQYILMFSSSSPRPLCFWEIPRHKSKVVDAAFLPPTNPVQPYSDLVYITKSQEIFILGPKDNRIESYDALTNKKALQGDLVFNQKTLELEVAKTIGEEDDSVYKGPLALGPITQSILSGPSHALPAPSVFFNEFMKNLVVAHERQENAEAKETNEEAEEMEEEKEESSKEEKVEGRSTLLQSQIVDIVSTIQTYPTILPPLVGQNYDSLVGFFRGLTVSPISLQPQPQTSAPKKETPKQPATPKQQQGTPKQPEAQKQTPDNKRKREKQQSPRGNTTTKTPPTTPRSTEKTQTPKTDKTTQASSSKSTDTPSKNTNTPQSKKGRQGATQSPKSPKTETPGKQDTLKRKRSGSQNGSK